MPMLHFVGHSMGGLASINYGVDYAANNSGKDVDIITISTPYEDNVWASSVWLATPLISKYNDFHAYRDLGGYNDFGGKNAMDLLAKKWEQYRKLENINLFAIGVTKAANESVDEQNRIGDGIVPTDVQLGGSYVVNGSKEIKNMEDESWMPDVANIKNDYYHVNTPDLIEVIEIINDQITN